MNVFSIRCCIRMEASRQCLLYCRTQVRNATPIARIWNLLMTFTALGVKCPDLPTINLLRNDIHFEQHAVLPHCDVILSFLYILKYDCVYRHQLVGNWWKYALPFLATRANINWRLLVSAFGGLDQRFSVYALCRRLVTGVNAPKRQ